MQFFLLAIIQSLKCKWQKVQIICAQKGAQCKKKHLLCIHKVKKKIKNINNQKSPFKKSHKKSKKWSKTNILSTWTNTQCAPSPFAPRSLTRNNGWSNYKQASTLCAKLLHFWYFSAPKSCTLLFHCSLFCARTCFIFRHINYVYTV